MSARENEGVLGIFDDPDKSVEAVRALKKDGYAGQIEIFAAVPPHGMLEEFDVFKSPVKFFTLTGGLLGCITGFALSIGLSWTWNLIVGGKSPGVPLPYVVIGFELTILIGALATLTGLAIHILLTRKKAAYDPRFTDDHIGIFVPCPADRRGAVEQMLAAAGAAEVRVAA